MNPDLCFEYHKLMLKYNCENQNHKALHEEDELSHLGKKKQQHSRQHKEKKVENKFVENKVVENKLKNIFNLVKHKHLEIKKSAAAPAPAQEAAPAPTQEAAPAPAQEAAPAPAPVSKAPAPVRKVNLNTLKVFKHLK